jgi:hypothetical protein
VVVVLVVVLPMVRHSRVVYSHGTIETVDWYESIETERDWVGDCSIGFVPKFPEH